MLTMRIAPVLFLVACSLEVGGTQAEDPAPNDRDVPDMTPVEVDAAAPDTPGCTRLDADGKCASIVIVDAGAESDLDGGSDGSTCCQDDCPNGGPDDGKSADCFDQCPSDPQKTSPGICGCGNVDADSDDDDIVDCKDACVGFSDDSKRQGCTCDPALKACGNRPPSVTLVEPISDEVDVDQLSIKAEASDEDGTIRRVTLFVDGKRMREEREAPYVWGAGGSSQYELRKLSAGTHVIEVEAEDDLGATARAQKELTLLRD